MRRTRNVPFVLAGLLGLVLSLLVVESLPWAMGLGLVGLATGIATARLPWDRLPRWAPVVMACVVLALIGLVLVAVDGRSPGAVSLVLLPVLWMALFGSRAHLALVLALVPAVVLLPLLVTGVSAGQALAEAAMVGGVAVAVGYAVEHLVARLHASQEADRAARQRMRTILDTAAGTGVLTWTPDRVVTSMSRGAEELFGFRGDEALGRLSPADILGAEAMAALAAAMGFGNPADPSAEGDDLIHAGRWAHEKRSVTGITTRLSSRLRPTWVQLDLAAIVDARGAVSEYVLVAHDVTDLRLAQDELESVQRDLASVVDVLHETQEGKDVRTTVCQQTRRLAASDVAAILEPCDDDLIVTACDGLDVADLRLPTEGVGSAAAIAFRSGRRVTVSDTRRHPLVPRDTAETIGVRSLLYEPIRHGTQVVAVLGVGWQAPDVAVSERVGESVWALAAEAGMAMRRERQLRTLEDHARLDGLTGLPNRRSWDALLEEHLSTRRPGLGEACGPEDSLCLAILDLDHFKAYNDRHGHQAGDRLLQDAAAQWRRQLRTTDVLARYGGEEFGVLLPACGTAEATVVLERLRAATPAGCTVSAGMACWDGQEAAQGLVSRADAALYHAKSLGRDRLVTHPWDPSR